VKLGISVNVHHIVSTQPEGSGAFSIDWSDGKVDVIQRATLHRLYLAYRNGPQSDPCPGCGVREGAQRFLDEHAELCPYAVWLSRQART
jgi:hypothetical protein